MYMQPYYTKFNGRRYAVSSKILSALAVTVTLDATLPVFAESPVSSDWEKN